MSDAQRAQRELDLGDAPDSEANLRTAYHKVSWLAKEDSPGPARS